MKFVDQLISELQQFGVQQLFGIPGDFVLPLFQQLQQRDALPLYCLSHEPSAAFAADAAARITNRPSAVILTYGAGALNAVNAVAQAYVEHVPLIIIAGFPAAHELSRGLQIHHQARSPDSQRAVYQEVTACQVRLDNPQTAAAELRRALSQCVEQSRPVLIEIPRDAVHFSVSPLPCYKAPAMPAAELTGLRELLCTRLRKARRPVILSGIDVRRFNARQSVEDLALMLGTPLISTFLGRACIDQQHPQYAGIFLDGSDSRPRELLADADLILQIGVIHTDSNFAAHKDLFPADKVINLQQQYSYVDDRHFYQVDLPTVLNALLTEDLSPAPQRLLTPATAPAKNDGFNATSVVETIDSLLLRQSTQVPVISDIGDCLFASLHAQPSQLLAPSYYASMGYSVPAAIGLQAATGQRPVVLVGDGAFLMTGLELGHCQRYGFNPVIVLFNNQKWDMINAFAPELNCTGLVHWDYQQLARGMGAAAVRVRNTAELELAFTAAWADPAQVHLIEVWLADAPRTERLQGFANTFLSAAAQLNETELS
ncbi:thiamine pyrophosphate-binding protein [Pseudidiomarina sp.]|uniref:thiamine pyrophosphate-binding protein n=1 Tax=Pseudidiomarina sp. TaxID=2081707 RepID=UPI00299E3E4D|nr:thiamine pyrophosphate-binding protein [Pseudidiomarina sp.]MDX1705908.1 thiamine pyrophosphate-binding protein [Pseudidiomarina sp.]